MSLDDSRPTKLIYSFLGISVIGLGGLISVTSDELSAIIEGLIFIGFGGAIIYSGIKEKSFTANNA
ncbi:hypothetical protein Q9L42_020750 (plasmid) [Methylomarinum sp. Ch1-1]|uniref:Uncharacterized protein n=1 Tax=Methylomarinum roseum TaxID=3067653 RepID=A0AAU7P0C6_9GAMM|nr:hypothetical protein [Methylomarinum sp. Ch1-1]MDP4518949.1 hypothetical protein [Methylomarinum sp. Ch1-1]MDP4523349.1 hypothetical protein [Methylomarinum sp. Ch1-1]